MVGVARERAAGPALLQQFTQRAAGLRRLRRQAVHFDVASVEHHDAAVLVEHDEALAHRVERSVEQRLLLARPFLGERGEFLRAPAPGLARKKPPQGRDEERQGSADRQIENPLPV